MPDLAIVIPAYKPDFFEETLNSLKKQTDGRFRVYIGDDASLADLKSIAEPFFSQLDMAYHRFPDNLGAISLVQHWSRCVSLSSEPWVWLFSDDDVVSPDCVAMFYKTMQFTGSQYDLYRFDAEYIDATGQWVRSPAVMPSTASSLELLYHRVINGAISAMPEHIFSRHAYERDGGFVDFPLAWCSDHASWMRIARKTGLHVIPGARVKIRNSGVNISSCKNQGVIKAEACLAFLAWFKKATDDKGFFGVHNDRTHFMIEAIWQQFPKWFYNRLFHDGFPLNDRNAVVALMGKIADALVERAGSFLLTLEVHVSKGVSTQPGNSVNSLLRKLFIRQA